MSYLECADHRQGHASWRRGALRALRGKVTQHYKTQHYNTIDEWTHFYGVFVCAIFHPHKSIYNSSRQLYVQLFDSSAGDIT